MEQLQQDHFDPPALKRDPLNHTALLLPNDDDSSLSTGGTTSDEIKAADTAANVAEAGFSKLRATASYPLYPAVEIDALSKGVEETWSG